MSLLCQKRKRIEILVEHDKEYLKKPQQKAQITDQIGQ